MDHADRAEPSPTAAATRLPEPPRTSPAAKMPGTFVSNRNGSRSSVQPRGRRSAAGQIRAGEDVTLLVALDDAGDHLGARRGADEDEHRRRVERRAPRPLATLRSATRSSRSVARDAVTSTRVMTSMFGVASMRSTRYCDMDFRASRRGTSIVTFRA